MTSTGAEPPPGGSGWHRGSVRKLGVVVGAVGFGALLPFAPLALSLTSGFLLVVLVIKMNGDEDPSTGHNRADLTSPQASSSGVSPDSAQNRPHDPIIANDAVFASPAYGVFEVASSAKAPPQQAVAAGPSRKTIELLAGTGSKTPTPATSAAQQPLIPGLVASVGGLAAGEKTTAAAPPQQDTPSRSLIPENTNSIKPAAPAAASPPKVEEATTPVAPTGGAAILARLRQQRSGSAQSNAAPAAAAVMAAAAKAKADLEASGATATAAATAAPPPPAKLPLTIVYGSQTGTCEEIARNLAASAVENGYNATCAAMDEFGFGALSPSNTPLLIVISSSTGDGDPPDNAAAFFVGLRRKPEGGAKPLAGVRYTVLGLGDSNYTRFMHVPRTIKSKLAELGCAEFYKSAEADEVDGVESVVEPWLEGLLEALGKVMPQGSTGAPVVAAKPATQPAPAPKPAAASSGGVAAILAAAAKAKADLETAKSTAAPAASPAAAAAQPSGTAAATPKPAAASSGGLAAIMAAAAKAKADLEAAAAAKEQGPAAAAVPSPTAAGAAAAVGAAAEEAAVEPAVSSPPAPQTTISSKRSAEQPGLGAEAPEATAALAQTTSGDAAAATAAPLNEAAAVPAVSASDDSLLPTELVPVLEAGATPTAATAGLPTIAESRVLDGAEAEAAAAAAEEEDPLLTPLASAAGNASSAGPAAAAAPDGVEEAVRPDSTTSALSSTFRRNAEAAKRAAEAARRRRSVGTVQAKPINVNFPKREEAIVKRKDEKAYGMLLGLAPVGVDTKGAPALLPCRIKVQWEKDEAKVRAVRDKEAARPTREERHRVEPQGNYTAAQPFWAHISDARYETAFWSDRKVLHLEFSIRGSNIAYEPGDSVGVLPANHPDLVANLCKRLRLSPDRVFHVHQAGAAGAAAAAAGGAAAAPPRVASHIPSPCSLAHALTYCVDLTSATRKSVLRLLAEHTTDAAEKRTLLFLSAKGGRDAYAHEISEHQPSLLDLLVRFHSCHPPLDALLDALPPLMPRMYSISSSQRDPAGGPNHLSVAMSVVRFKTRYGTRLGVATTWLDRLAAPFTADSATPPSEPIWVPLFLRRAADFKPPADLATPLIMVGPGTGVAPFRGFLQDRKAALLEQKPPAESVGEAALFFGCRREDEDYLYREELEGFRQDGTLAALHVAFSRAQADKVYVQDLIKQQGEKVWALLQAGARVFVCGDGARMAKDVHATLVGIAVQYGGLSEEDAAAYFTAMTQDKRYVRDVWS